MAGLTSMNGHLAHADLQLETMVQAAMAALREPEERTWRPVQEPREAEPEPLLVGLGYTTGGLAGYMDPYGSTVRARGGQTLSQ